MPRKKKNNVIRFDDKEFLKLYKLPAENDTRRAKFIYKALEIYERIKQPTEKLSICVSIK